MNAPEIDDGGYEALRSALQANPDVPAVYVPNPGNAGDALIHDSTFQFLDRDAIPYTVGTLNETELVGKRLFMGGGGAMVDLYQGMARFIAEHLDGLDTLVIFPHTIRAHPELLGRMGRNCHLFCREQGSLDYCRANAASANVHFCPDMAFLWNRSTNAVEYRDVVRGTASTPGLAKYLAKATFQRVRLRGRVVDGALNARRLDVERADPDLPKNNVDVSDVFSPDRFSRALCTASAHHMAGFLDLADRIDTDRLHCGILGGLLGKRVTLRDNVYGKNAAVYEASISERLPNVAFVPAGA